MKKNFNIIGQYLREKREAAGLTQAEVRKHLGYTADQMISKFELGLMGPPLDSIPTLIKIYKLDKEEFLEVLRTAGYKNPEGVISGTRKKTVVKKVVHKKFLIIGKYLKEKRERVGLSQGEVGRLIGHSSPQLISDWERGICGPPLVALPTLVKALKLKSDEFIEVMLKAERVELEKLLR